jgi:hypothetical protein
MAQLIAAWNMDLFFAVSIGAIDEPMAERIKADVWAGLMEVAAEQAELQRAAEPVGRFRDLLVAALSTGRAHIASSSTGDRPGAVGLASRRFRLERTRRLHRLAYR